MKIAVWIVRLLLGGTFLLSGVTKIVDPYGSLIKIEAYLTAWGLNELIPTGLALVGGCALATLEFLVGLLLSTGSLRRAAPWGALSLMAFMLPLTVYIAVANPVDDCGCFGDFMVISNQATMWKNVVLTSLAIFLCRYNRRARWIFAPWIQWVQIAAGVAYMIFLAVVGYHEQPLLDFRAYPVGEPLTDSGGEAVYSYERNGEVREFAEDLLPDESDGWEYIGVRFSVPDSGKMLAIFDRESGEDVTDEVLNRTSDVMLMLLPYPSDAGAAGSYTANELQSAMEARYGRGAFVCLTASDSVAVDRALDLMMANYPVYYADPKALSAIARGQIAVVYLRDGGVVWKRTLNSINLDLLSAAGADPAMVYAVDGPRIFRGLTLLYVAANAVIAFVGILPYAGRLRRRRSKGA